MKLYRIDYDASDDEDTSRIAWEGTQADAKRRAKELEQKHGHWRVDDPVQVEVPTDKAGLLAWLNENCNRGSN